MKKYLQVVLKDNDIDMIEHLRRIKKTDDSELNLSMLVRNLLHGYHDRITNIDYKSKIR